MWTDAMETMASLRMPDRRIRDIFADRSADLAIMDAERSFHARALQPLDPNVPAPKDSPKRKITISEGMRDSEIACD